MAPGAPDQAGVGCGGRRAEKPVSSGRWRWTRRSSGAVSGTGIPKERRYWRNYDGGGRYFGSMVAVMGVKDRRTNRISAAVAGVERAVMHEFVTERTAENALVYTDDAYG